MPSLGMEGPYDFTAKEIEKLVAANRKGNYALGQANAKGGLNAHYIGRSDGDLKVELKANLSRRYPQFKFSYAASAKDAF